MFSKVNYKTISLLLIFLSIVSFFLGFYLDENSAGHGSYHPDFKHIWNNLKIYLNNDILSSLSNSDYSDSRTPIAYILHKLFNPFTESENLAPFSRYLRSKMAELTNFWPKMSLKMAFSRS